MATSIADQLQALHRCGRWTPEVADAHCGLKPGSFRAWPGQPEIVYLPRRVRDARPLVLRLRGTFLFQTGRRVLRGYPKIFYGRRYQATLPAAVQAERALMGRLRDEEIRFEQKVDGVNIRLYTWNGEIYCATRYRFDGSPSGGLGLPYGDLARRVAERRYPGALDAAREGWTPVFELTSPALELAGWQGRPPLPAGSANGLAGTPAPTEEDDLPLIDVMTADHRFLPRREKEEFAARYGLNVVPLFPKETLRGAMTPEAFEKRCRSLEYLASQRGIEGFVAKAYQDGEPVYLKLKAPEMRRLHQGVGLEEAFLNRLVASIVQDADDAERADVDWLCSLAEAEIEEDHDLAVGDDLRARLRATVERSLAV